MQAVQLRLKDRNRFRLGNVDLSSLTEVIHSDTLFSGLANARRMLYGSKEATEFVTWFQNGRIKISSAFYCVEVIRNQDTLKTLYFLPKPLLRFERSDGGKVKSDETSERKAVKKLKFLSRTLFEEVLQKVERNNKGDWVARLNLLECPTFGEEFALSSSELEDVDLDKLRLKKFRRETEEPKVQLLRITNTSEDLYYQTDYELSEVNLDDCWTFRPHLYFLIDHSLPADEEKKFLASLRLLGDEGIGGERSTGRGQFDGTQIEDFTLNTGGEMQVALSLVSPVQDNLIKLYAYDIIQRGGFVHSNHGTALRKRKVRMLKEGAIFTGPVSGRLVSVKPANVNLDHEVWANGINFGIHFGGAV